MTEEGDEHVDEQQPRVGEPLPHASDAYIKPEKLVDYALDPQHPAGRHKAAVFLQALDIERDDRKYYSSLDALPDHGVTGVREPDDERGAYTWEVLVPIQG